MNKPPLPDFKCASYRRMAPLWTRLDDLYEGSSAWLDFAEDGTVSPNSKTKSYIPQFAKEHPLDYQARLIRTPYSDRFAQAINDFIGLIFHNELTFSEDFPPILREHFNNLDNEGTTGMVLLAQMAIAAMRRGHTFALIDCPNSSGSGLVSLETAATIRPYWVHIEAPQVLSWRSVVVGGRRILSQAVIRQCHNIPDGQFGEKEEVSYLVLTPGRYDTYTIEGKGDQAKAIHHPDRSGIHGLNRAGRIEPFQTIPLVCFYGGRRVRKQNSLFESEPPLKSLADLNLTHYQLFSDHLSKIHYCCFPTPVRVGMMGEEGDLVLGPGVTVDVPPGGAFLWAEPQASSIQQSRHEIEAIEVAMDFLGTQFLVKPSDRQAAMVSLIQAAKVESQLDLFARNFIQGINQALAIHAAYLGIAPGTIKMDTKFFQQSNSDPNLLQSYITLYDRLVTLPPELRRSLLSLAQRRGYLPPDVDVDQELAGLPTNPQPEKAYA